MKITMNNQRHSNALMALLLLAAAVLACSTSTSDETDKANKLVGEGNALVQEAKTFLTDAEAKRQKMLSTPVAQLADARDTGREAIEAYDNAKGKCKEASKKYEEASKLKIKDKFREYLQVKVKEYDKRAELVETAKGTPQALIDSKSRSSFIAMANANNERVDRLRKEADDLAAEATKLEKDNPNMFKKDE